MNAKKARGIAFYLPQFHPTPENDAWWGKGFTEWTNTAKAKPLFRGHYQPHVPADLGFYDLRVPETRRQQADMARAFGIEAFCYYHYWFAGRRILERPFDEVLASGEPDFPFCLCWANGTWSGIWHGAADRILIEQTYPGPEDYARHFEAVLPAFRDSRYVRVDGEPLFVVFEPTQLPEPRRFVDQWKSLARHAGLGGIHLVAYDMLSGGKKLIDAGFDATIKSPPIKKRRWIDTNRFLADPKAWFRSRIELLLGLPHLTTFKEWAETACPVPVSEYDCYPCVVHAWDNTARSGSQGYVLRDPDPEQFRSLLQSGVGAVSHYQPEKRLVFLKSWNEWAEGNHLEPDLRDGKAYLQVVADVFGAG